MQTIDRLCNALQAGSNQLCEDMDNLMGMMSTSSPLESPYLQTLFNRFRAITEDIYTRLQSNAVFTLQPISVRVFQQSVRDDASNLSAPSPFQSSPNSGQESSTGSNPSYLGVPIPQPIFRHSSAPPLVWAGDMLGQNFQYDFATVVSSQESYPSSISRSNMFGDFSSQGEF